MLMNMTMMRRMKMTMEDDTEGDSGDLCDSDDVTINNPQQESQPKTSSHLHQLLNVTPAADDDLTHQVLALALSRESGRGRKGTSGNPMRDGCRRGSEFHPQIPHS